MTNKKIWLGILVMALVFGMTVVGCGNGSTNGNGGESIVTFSLNKVNNKSFTVTMEGAKWKPDLTSYNYASLKSWLLNASGKATQHSTGVEVDLGPSSFDYVRTSDALLTFTFDDDRFTFINATITLKTDDVRVTSCIYDYGDGTLVYRANPAKSSITLP